MSKSTCSRSGAAALFAVKGLNAGGRGKILRQALAVAQIEFDLIGKKVEPPRAHFLARLEYERMRRAA